MRFRGNLWLLWSASSIILTMVLGYVMLAESTSKTFFMPGPLSDGHYQLTEACDACHTDAYGSGEVLQKACINCHGDVRVKPFDSHPKAKFKDPRNAELIEKINALECVTCHTEHNPEITRKDGVTQPGDFCVYCHVRVGEDRESHREMPFSSCKDSGCHNFHDNRALYTKYLVDHYGEPDLLDNDRMPEREFASLLSELPDYPADKYPVQPLGINDIDVPEPSIVSSDIRQQWSDSKHAGSGVNCSACHLIKQSDESLSWVDHPGDALCVNCHDTEVSRFKLGKHGMRIAQGMSPMTPGEARLPMKADAAEKSLTCNTCHSAHDYNLQKAAVDSCLTCHDDAHSLAYMTSKHYALWEAEVSGTAQTNTGVTCAGCHMPRVSYDVNDWMSRIIVDHNQSANLSPNSKMIRSVCQNCHGLAFSIDAMADKALIKSNFKGEPKIHVKSMTLAEQDYQKHQREIPEQDGGDDAGMFGF